MSPKKVTLVYALLLLGIYSISALELRSQSLDLGGSARGYIFFRLEDLPDFIDLRRDTEFTSFRFTLDSEFNPSIRFEAHGVLDFLSPRGSGAARIAQSRTSTYLPLDSILNESDSHLLTSRFDRLNLQFKINDVRLIVGRQAISWGVAHFWPTVDFFSSFAPERIHRDYKDGVDAARAIVPLGDYSELQIIGAVLGPSFEKDGSAAAQLRFHMGTWDLGMVGGSFHGDTVAGVFITTGVQGTAYRGEVTWTRSGAAGDQLLDRARFWRVSLGLDRQLTPNTGISGEFHFNGFGVGDPSQYIPLAVTDRVRRGEMSSLGRYYTGGAYNWQMHPLVTLAQALLFNWNDPSLLWLPSLNWSTSDNSSLLVGAQWGIGPGFKDEVSLESEYGPVPATLYAGAKWYF